LLVSLLGSLAYLLGVALLYHTFGSVDIALLAEQMEPSPAVWAAMGLMSAGLLLKTALFPLHFWLPPAHASAPAPVSALLSALVVKASFYILLRLWLEIFPLTNSALGQLLGLLGAAAVLWGGLQALRQTQLKMLIAYSTVSQLGYLFLAFPLGTSIAWKGALYLLLSHALAKAAMFMAAGNILRFGGHDRIADLDRVAQRLPLTLTAFALSGVSIMGLPPSGGFIAKWLLLEAAMRSGLWWWGIILILGGLLAAGYVFKVIGQAFTQAEVPYQARTVPVTMEWAALALALAAILLGLFALWPLALMEIGLPFGEEVGG
jgi:formate hydrogenlyase subunit 3/multisubunit Na+/H+ antiporter MnhD subunit